MVNINIFPIILMSRPTLVCWRYDVVTLWRGVRWSSNILLVSSCHLMSALLLTNTKYLPSLHVRGILSPESPEIVKLKRITCLGSEVLARGNSWEICWQFLWLWFRPVNTGRERPVVVTGWAGGGKQPLGNKSRADWQCRQRDWLV